MPAQEDDLQEIEMALQIELKPGERFILGNAIITNDDHRTKLRIDGDAPILREPDIIRPEEANTPCKNIYLTVQMMYLSEDPQQYHEKYFSLMEDVCRAAPSTLSYFEEINNKILTGALYKALKKTKELIAYEKELMTDAGCSASLCADSKDHTVSA